MTPSWTPKAARARALRKIKAFENARDRLCLGVAGEFSDIDEYICGLCDQLSDGLEEPLKELREAIDFHVETHPEGPF